MRDLPKNVDADAVIEIGRYLDDQGKGAPVSIADAIRIVRKTAGTKLTAVELEELILECAAARHLAVVLDSRDWSAVASF
ncbi:hypothetical protein NKI20_28040 [Mesorhizobium sp. M0830]|uniref:hypothetical protein n=1 Tax=unclassified Mesorhizobium TaxID=325217 RepID=UPI0003F5A235|nr:hypothetical protein [Mesorhizobium sp. LNHC252B00]